MHKEEKKKKEERGAGEKYEEGGSEKWPGNTTTRTRETVEVRPSLLGKA